MPTLNLTDAAVKRIKTPIDLARVEYWDTTTIDGKPTGLGLRVSQTGGPLLGHDRPRPQGG